MAERERTITVDRRLKSAIASWLKNTVERAIFLGEWRRSSSEIEIDKSNGRPREHDGWQAMAFPDEKNKAEEVWSLQGHWCLLWRVTASRLRLLPG